MQPEVADNAKQRGLDPRAVRTRARVLKATGELLAEGGLTAATVNEVARRAGVNKTTIYRNWPDPADLIVDTLASLLPAGSPPDTGDLRTDLTAMFTGLVESLQAPPWARLLPSIIGAAGDDPAIAELHGTFTRGRRTIAASVIARAVDRGQLPAVVDADQIIEAVAGPIYYRFLMTHEPIDRPDVVDLVDRTLKRLAGDPASFG